MKYISLETLTNFLNSFFRFGKMSIFTFCIQILFLYLIADTLILDLYDLDFSLAINQRSLGARFLTRLFQLYLFKACLRRLMDILGYEKLGIKHYVLVFIALFYPIYVGHHAYLVFALAAIPGVNFKLRDGLNIHHKLQFQ